MENILEIRDLSKKYENFELNNINLSLPKGTIMGFVGENGAGKTTTISLILNMIHRDSGTINVFGLDNQKHEQEIKEQIGVVLAEGFFSLTMRNRDVASVMRRLYRNWDDALFKSYMEKFALPEKKMIKDYSSGMRMKLCIAAALSHHPKLLLLDEPTSGLDPIVRSEILDVFLEFIQDEEHSIFLSSHITSDLERIADYITFLHKGNIVFSQTKDDMLDSYGIIKCGRNDVSQIDKADVIGCRENSFGYEVLVQNKQDMKRKYSHMVIDDCGIDEIMLFYVKGEEE